MAGFAKRGFIAPRSYRGVDNEKDNEDTWREDGQRCQTRHAQAFFIRREDQDRAGWPARPRQHDRLNMAISEIKLADKIKVTA
jgi:hypothetical protein